MNQLGEDVEIVGGKAYHTCYKSLSGKRRGCDCCTLVDRSNGERPAFWCPRCGELLKNESVNMILKLHGTNL